MKTNNLLKFRVSKLSRELGEIVRITFLILLAITLIAMLSSILSPFTIELYISLEYLIMAVIIAGALAVLLPHEKGEAEVNIEPQKRIRWLSFAPAALFIGITVSLIIFYSIKDIRLAPIISSLSGLFATILTLIYRGKM